MADRKPLFSSTETIEIGIDLTLATSEHFETPFAKFVSYQSKLVGTTVKALNFPLTFEEYRNEGFSKAGAFAAARKENGVAMLELRNYGDKITVTVHLFDNSTSLP